jgi:hypothetical protein
VTEENHKKSNLGAITAWRLLHHSIQPLETAWAKQTMPQATSPEVEFLFANLAS